MAVALAQSADLLPTNNALTGTQQGSVGELSALMTLGIDSGLFVLPSSGFPSWIPGGGTPEAGQCCQALWGGDGSLHPRVSEPRQGNRS